MQLHGASQRQIIRCSMLSDVSKGRLQYEKVDFGTKRQASGGKAESFKDATPGCPSAPHLAGTPFSGRIQYTRADFRRDSLKRAFKTTALPRSDFGLPFNTSACSFEVSGKQSTQKMAGFDMTGRLHSERSRDPNTRLRGAPQDLISRGLTQRSSRSRLFYYL
jgi:hypothetical protein